MRFILHCRLFGSDNRIFGCGNIEQTGGRVYESFAANLFFCIRAGNHFDNIMEEIFVTLLINQKVRDILKTVL